MTIARLIALPVLSAGIIGAALGLAGTASATTYSQPDVQASPIAVPHTYASPMISVVPFGQWVNGPHVYVPNVDTTVQQSR